LKGRNFSHEKVLKFNSRISRWGRVGNKRFDMTRKKCGGWGEGLPKTVNPHLCEPHDQEKELAGGEGENRAEESDGRAKNPPALAAKQRSGGTQQLLLERCRSLFDSKKARRNKL